MEVVTGTSSHHRSVPVLGLHQTVGSSTAGTDTAAGSDNTGGRIVVYGDSNCIDSAHLQFGTRLLLEFILHNYLCSPIHFLIVFSTDCFKLLDELLTYSSGGIVPNFMSPAIPLSPPTFNPERMEG